MLVVKKNSWLVLAILLGAAPVFGLQQSQAPAPAPSSQSGQSASATAPVAKKPSTADENPFPEDISRKAAQGDDAPAAEKAPAPAAENKPAAKDEPAAKPGTTPAPAESDSSSRSRFQGLGEVSDDGNRISNGAGGYIVNPKLAAEDVRVGGFYLDQKDYKGAYARYKEAELVNPENADAVFGLAQAAQGLNRKDEAVQNYRIYLDAFPDGKKAKEARKALAALGERAAK